MNEREPRDPHEIEVLDQLPDHLQEADPEMVQQEEAASRRASAPAVVTTVLVAINVLVYLAFQGAELLHLSTYDTLISYLAKDNTAILHGEFWRLLSPVLVHADIFHLAVNSFSLWNLGQIIEKMFGRRVLILTYVLSGIGGSLLSLGLSPNSGVGASGAIFGMMGLLAFLVVRNPQLWKTGFGQSIAVNLVINLVYGFSNARIDNAAHLGGLITGFAAGGLQLGETQGPVWVRRWLYGPLLAVLLLGGGYLAYHAPVNVVGADLDSLRQSVEKDQWKQSESQFLLLENKVKKQSQKEELYWYGVFSAAGNSDMTSASARAAKLVKLNPMKGHYLMGLLAYQIHDYDTTRKELTTARSLGASSPLLDQILSGLPSGSK